MGDDDAAGSAEGGIAAGVVAVEVRVEHEANGRVRDVGDGGLNPWGERCELVVVRQRIAALVKARRTEAETVAAHPTQEFDARYGAGPVKPDAFVRTVYADLKRK